MAPATSCCGLEGSRATLGSFCGRVLVETWTSSPGANETNWFEDPLTCCSAMRTPDDSAVLNCPLGFDGITGRTRGSMVVPTRRMKSTGTILLRDNSASHTLSPRQQPKALLRETVDELCWSSPSGGIAWDNPIVPGIEGCSSMILKSQIFIPSRVGNRNSSN